MKRFFGMALTVTAMLVALCCKKDNNGIDVDGLVTEDPSAWSIIGTIGGANWNSDITLNLSTDEGWCVAKNVAIAAGEQFKFRKDKGWDENLGYGEYKENKSSLVSAGEKLFLSPGGGNISLLGGAYDIWLAPDIPIAYILKAGEKFTHAAEGIMDKGGDIHGDTGTLQPSEKKSGLTYQINVYSFADSDGDGWGDFQGIIDHLDYLDALGVSGIWLSPIQASQSYHAYDIKDYYSVNPVYGGKDATSAQAEAKFKDLIAAAKEKNIEIYLDYVLNHSGDQNPWFKKALEGDEKYSDYYVISDHPTNKDNDSRNTSIDNFAGQTGYGMGGWHSAAKGNSGYTGTLHFLLDVSNASAPKLTITKTDASPQNSNTDTSVNWFIWENNARRMYKTSDNVYEITLNINNDWGVLVRSSDKEWGNYKWGARAGDQSITFGTPKTLVNGDAANDIIFSSDVLWYFGSFDASMPDLNYGPYTSCAESPAFIDLAASADKWINMGIGGLRLDAVMWIYQRNATANAAFLSAWYDHCNATYKAAGGEGDFFMVGEAYDYDATKVGPYYKGLPACFDFAFYGTLKDRIAKAKGYDFAGVYNGIVRNYQNGYNARLYEHSSGMIEVPKLSNHDEDRVGSDLGKNPQKMRLAAALLLTVPGKSFIYQGEELGYTGTKANGDQNVRQPILWEKGGKVPSSWSSFDKSILKDDISVEAQSADPRSLLSMYRAFSYARNVHPALYSGTLEPYSTKANEVGSWKLTGSGEELIVFHNFGAAPVSVETDEDLSKLVIANGNVSYENGTLSLPAYSSVVYQLK